jgi:hypothetical protein
MILVFWRAGFVHEMNDPISTEAYVTGLKSEPLVGPFLAMDLGNENEDTLRPDRACYRSQIASGIKKA